MIRINLASIVLFFVFSLEAQLFVGTAIFSQTRKSIKPSNSPLSLGNSTLNYYKGCQLYVGKNFHKTQLHAGIEFSLYKRLYNNVEHPWYHRAIDSNFTRGNLFYASENFMLNFGASYQVYTSQKFTITTGLAINALLTYKSSCWAEKYGAKYQVTQNYVGQFDDFTTNWSMQFNSKLRYKLTPSLCIYSSLGIDYALPYTRVIDLDIQNYIEKNVLYYRANVGVEVLLKRKK